MKDSRAAAHEPTAHHEAEAGAPGKRGATHGHLSAEGRAQRGGEIARAELEAAGDALARLRGAIAARDFLGACAARHRFTHALACVDRELPRDAPERAALASLRDEAAPVLALAPAPAAHVESPLIAHGLPSTDARDERAWLATLDTRAPRGPRAAATIDAPPSWDEDRATLDISPPTGAAHAPGTIDRPAQFDGAIQRRASGTPTADIPRTAALGVSGASSALPHLDAIQASFGAHDVRGIEAHTAPDACAAIGAEAYATGNQVAFANTPDLHTAAHEAAHVVQQRAGVQLLGGVGEAGNPYEQHADAVADRVVRGESAAELLGGVAHGASATAVQRRAKTEVFAPETYSDPHKIDGYAGQVAVVHVGVRNEKEAPHDTEYEWSLLPDRPDLLEVEAPETSGARATLRARIASWFPSETFTPTLRTTSKSAASGSAVDAPPVTITATEPTVDWTHTVQRAGGSAKQKRTVSGDDASTEATLFAGDTITIRARFTAHQLEKAKNAMLGITVSPRDIGANDSPAQMTNSSKWVSDKEMELTFRPEWAGHAAYELVAGRHDQAIATHALTLTVMQDLATFDHRCAEAQTRLLGASTHATTSLSIAAKNYEFAYTTLDQQLKAAEASERLGEDVIEALLFGAIGGAVGAVVAGGIASFGKSVAKLLGDDVVALPGLAEKIVTETTKDLAKAASKVPEKLIDHTAPKSAGGTDGTAGVGIVGKVQDQGGSNFNVPGQRPLQFYFQISAALSSAQEQAFHMIEAMQDASARATRDGTAWTPDFDPVALVDAAVARTMDVGDAPSEREYLQALWALWLTHHGAQVENDWKQETGEGHGRYLAGYKIKNNVRELGLEAVLRQVFVDGDGNDLVDPATGEAESADHWIDVYSAPARDAAQREIDDWTGES